MCSKFVPRQKAEEALGKAWENVKEFIRKFGKNVSNAPVGEQRAFIRSCRMVLENHAGNLSWSPEKKPEYWRADLPFTDPNNDKKNKSDLTDIVKFLVDEAKMLLDSMEVKHQDSESSLVMSRHQDSGEQYQDWGPDDLYERLKGHLHSLELDPQLKNRLLTTIETRRLSWPETKARELDLLINKLKLSEKNPRLAEQFRKELLAFADAETSAQSALSAPVHVPSHEGELEKDSFYVVMCCTNKIQEEENVDKSEMSESDCGKNDSSHLTLESEEDDLTPMMDFNLEEDVVDQRISSNSIEYVTDEGGLLQFICCSLSMEHVEGTAQEEQIHGPGGHEETDECEDVQKVLDEVYESCMVKSSNGPDDAAERVKAFKQFLLEEPQMGDVPEVLLNTYYKDIFGVPIYQKNFDMVKSDKPPEAVDLRCPLVSQGLPGD